MEDAIRQLAAMGINRAHARRGLESTRVGGRVDPTRAVEWCFSNPARSAPASRAPAGGSRRLNEQDVDHIMAMGFSRKHAERGLHLKRSRREAAIWCASTPDPSRPADRKRAGPKRAKKAARPKYAAMPKDCPVSDRIADTPELEAKRKAERKALEAQLDAESARRAAPAASPSKPAKRGLGGGAAAGAATSAAAAAARRRQKEREAAAARARTAAAEAERSKQKEADARRQRRAAAESSIRGGIDGAVAHMRESYGPERVRSTLNLIVKICRRILANPSEPKIRRIKLSNARVQRDLVRPLGALIIMRELGFVEEAAAGGGSQDPGVLVLPSAKTRTLKSRLGRVEAAASRGATSLPDDLRAVDAKQSPEGVLFAAIELRQTLVQIAELPESVALRSLSTAAGGAYAEILAPVAPVAAFLRKSGFVESQGGRFLRLERPDVPALRDAVADLDREVAARTNRTRAASCVRQVLASRGKSAASALVEKAQVSLNRVMRSPNVAAYRSLDLVRLVGKTGADAKEASGLFSALGWSISSATGGGINAVYERQGSDWPRLALQHLDSVWKAALGASARRKPSSS